MKRIFIVLFAILVGTSFQTRASHLLGGEISWDCITSGTDAGKIVFTLKLYRACAGINLGGSATINNPLYASYGGPSSISVSRTEQNDLAPECYDSTKQLNCASGNANVMEEHVYVSSPMQINGTPATTGSAFYYTSCCRPASIYMKNINGSGYYLRADYVPLYRSGYQYDPFHGIDHGGANLLRLIS